MSPLIACSWGWLLSLLCPWRAIELYKEHFYRDLPSLLALGTPIHLGMWRANQNPLAPSFSAQNVRCSEWKKPGREQDHKDKASGTSAFVRQIVQDKRWKNSGPLPGLVERVIIRTENGA